MSSRWARVLRGLTAAFFAVFVAGFSHVVGGGVQPGGVGVVLALAFSAVVCVALAGKTLSLLRLSIAVGFSQLAFHLLFSVGAGSVASGAGAGAGAGGGAAGAAGLTGVASVAGGGAAAVTGAAGVTGAATVAGGAATGSLGAVASAGVGSAGASVLPGMPGMAGMPGMSHGSDLLTLLATQGGGHAAPMAGMAAAASSWMWVAHLIAGLLTVVALRRGEQAFFGLFESARMHVLRLVHTPFVEPLRVRTLEVAADRRDPDHPAALVMLIGRLRHRGPPMWQFSQL
jgi:hypothetical protein